MTDRPGWTMLNKIVKRVAVAFVASVAVVVAAVAVSARILYKEARDFEPFEWDDDDYDFDGDEDEDGFVARCPGALTGTYRPEAWSCSEWRCMP
tara:strand:+ start:389 stop:670 length:282 start_codon:yes stop_codon:yes gene_type:complete